jgi:hypothetical protein
MLPTSQLGLANRKTRLIACLFVGFPTYRIFRYRHRLSLLSAADWRTKGAQMYRDQIVEFAAITLLVILVAAMYAGVFF